MKEEEGKEEEEEAVEMHEAPLPVPDSGLVTPTGLATPDHLVLRKRDVGAPQPPLPEEPPKPLFQVLQQKDTKVGGAAFGSSHTYVMGEEKEEKAKKGKGEAVNLIKSQKTKEVAITLNPSELENLTDDVLKEKYEATMAAGQTEREDVSDIIAEHQKKKAKKDKKDKKYKDFKF